MFSENYIEYVKKTANPAYTIEMAACALLEEWVELDVEIYKQDHNKQVDEVSDVCYQFVLFVYLTGIDINELKWVDTDNRFLDSVLSITSQYKKLITRGKQLDLILIKDKLNILYSHVMDIITAINCTVKEVEEYNIQKLDRRYKNVNA